MSTRRSASATPPTHAATQLVLISPLPFKPRWGLFWLLSVAVLAWMLVLIVLWYRTVHSRPALPVEQAAAVVANG